MDYVALWFILTGGFGYIPYEDVRTPQCGKAGQVVGLLVDRSVNPATAMWPDPNVAGVHCEADIRGRVAALAPGEYHLAATVFTKDLPFGTPTKPFIGIDPHTSIAWTREGDYVPPATPPIVPPSPPAPPIPLPTVTCTVQSVGKYADGDAKLTVRCNTNGTPVIPKTTAFTITPPKP